MVDPTPERMEPASPGAGRLESLDQAFRHLFDAVVYLFQAVRPTGNDSDIERKILDAWNAHHQAAPAAPEPPAKGSPVELQAPSQAPEGK